MHQENQERGSVATNHETNREVVIFIGGHEFKIHPGIHSVVEIKQLGGIPADYDLDEIGHGKIITLPDDGKVEIKGGEKFVGRPRSGSSS